MISPEKSNKSVETHKGTIMSETPQNIALDRQLRKDDFLLRVLVVDDNLEAAKTLGWMIEMLGHKVRLAYSGRHALETAKTFLPHAVLLDIGMPGMNGYEVCQIMKQSPELRKTAFIAQTGWDPKENKAMSKEAGFDHYLVKPIDTDALQKVFSSLIHADS